MVSPLVNVTVTVYPMMPYARLDIEDGRLKAAGCLGDVWHEIIGDFNYSVNSIYSLEGDEPHEVVLAAGTDLLPTGSHYAFQTTWYDVYLEEKEATITKLTYMFDPTMWYLFTCMIAVYTLILFLMLRCAEKYIPIAAVDLPPIPKLEKLWKFQSIIPKLRGKAMLYRQLRVRNEESLGNCLMASLSAVSNQGCYLRSHIASIRLSLLSFLVLGSIMNIALSAMLISQTKNYSLAITDETCAEQLCLGMPTYETFEVLNEKHLTCQFRPLRSHLVKFNLGIEFTALSPKFLKNDFRHRLVKFREHGITSRITRKWMKKHDHIWTTRQNDSVSMSQVAYPFIIYFVMIILSCLVLFLERLLHHNHTWIA